MRVARPTDNLAAAADMYAKGLGFTVLAQFTDAAAVNNSDLDVLHKSSLPDAHTQPYAETDPMASRARVASRRTEMTMSRQYLASMALALATLVVGSGIMGCGDAGSGSGAGGRTGGPLPKADAVDVTYYYLPG